MIRRSFRIGLFLGLLGGAVIALFKAVQGQRQPAATGPSEPWPKMPPPAPATRRDTTESPVHGDTLGGHVKPEPAMSRAAPAPAAPKPAPVAPTPEPVVPEPEPEPLHPEPAPAPPLPDEPPPQPVVPEPEPTPILPDPTEGVAPADAPTPVEPPPVKAAAPRKAAAKKAAKSTKKVRPAEPPAPAEPAPPPPVWVEAVGGVCPDTHPIKAKLTSKLFHLPGMFAYDRTNPDRCYANEEGATEDGLRKAKR